MMFSDKEREYLKSQILARIGTVSKNNQPDVAAVGFRLEGDNLVIPSLDMERTLKYKNIRSGNDLVSAVIDDVKSVDPFVPRGIKIHGTARIAEREGRFGRGLYIEVTPKKVWSWGIERESFEDGRPVYHVKDRQGDSHSTLKLGK